MCLLACAAVLATASCGGGELSDEEFIIERGENKISLPVYGADSINPIKTTSRSVVQALFAVYEPLFDFDESLKPQGVLAERAERAEDGMSAAVYLKKGVKWHDGAEFCAEDAVYTIDCIKSGNSLFKDNVANISRAWNDGGVLRLEFYEPTINIEGLLSFPIIKNGSAEAIEEKPNGTGGFEFAERAAGYIRLVPRGEDSADEVRVYFMRNSAACVSAVEAGEADAVSSAAVDLNSETPGGAINAYDYTSNRLTFLGFNCRLEKYASPCLRTVICETVDRQIIVENAYYGRADACILPINPKSELYAPANSIMFDTAGTMSAAGFTKEKGFYADSEGNRVQIKILVPDTDTKRTACAGIIAQMLCDFGIYTEVEETEFGVYCERVQNGDYDAFLGETEMMPNLDTGFLTRGDNYFGFYSEALDGAARRLEDDPSEYARIFAENPPFAPILYERDRVVYRSSLSGVSEPTFYREYRGMENWYFRATAGEE